ncbi:MAG TPA: TIGR00282 family metallophosphoesterase [Bacillota bacterium]|nr:TIGR00282 family metallophosphoesterase [Bacillota bacterium]
MKILFIGDVYGSPGRSMLEQYLPTLKEKYKPNIVIVNGENAAGGRGITEKIYKQFLSLGVHVVTMGNHTWDQREIFEFVDDANFLIRPANFPSNNPGKGIVYLNYNGKEVAVMNLQGRTFLSPIEDPFAIVDELIMEAKKRTNIIFLDFHAEATSEKLAMGWYVDGRISAIVGTHTHVQTADERILPDGTGYITDVGMTGPYNGIIGVDKDIVIQRFKTNLPNKFKVAKGPKQLNGVLFHINDETGEAESVERILINDSKPLFT